MKPVKTRVKTRTFSRTQKPEATKKLLHIFLVGFTMRIQTIQSQLIDQNDSAWLLDFNSTN